MSKRAFFYFNLILNPLYTNRVSYSTGVLVVTSCGAVGAVYTCFTINADTRTTNTEHTMSLP